MKEYLIQVKTYRWHTVGWSDAQTDEEFIEVYLEQLGKVIEQVKLGTPEPNDFEYRGIKRETIITDTVLT